jgi:serine/threonine-protein kinase
MPGRVPHDNRPRKDHIGAMLSMPEKPIPPQIGPYRVLERLGYGSATEVFLVRDPRHPPSVPPLAIKRLHLEGLESPDLVDSFINEIEFFSIFRHPNLPRAFHRGTDGPLPYVVMEFLDGQSAREMTQRLLRMNRPAPVVFVVAIVMEILKAVSHLHHQKTPQGAPLNLVHRELGAHRVMVGYDGRVHLSSLQHLHVARWEAMQGGADVGIALGDRPPEMINNSQIDQRADVWSLGLLLYEISTGQHPFQIQMGENQEALTRRIAKGKFEDPRKLRPDLPPRLAEVIQSALRADPGRRFRQVEELSVALGGVVESNRAGPEQIGAAIKRIFADAYARTAHRRPPPG